MSLATGTRLGPYEILSPLGAGGMGEVYRARDTKLERDVALKVLPEKVATDRDALVRFEREAKALAKLSHPNILSVFDFGQDGSVVFAVAELLEGETLREALVHGALPPRRALEVAGEIARGLAAAHAKGIVHRDLKPENIFITRDGHVKVLDFGLAAQVPVGGEEASRAQTLTGPGTVVGTVGYMAPEQVRGAPADHRADIFAFGAVVYEMLAGRRAFSGGSAADTLSAILKEDPPEISDGGGSVSPGLERIVRRCLEKNPEQRFQSATDAAFALEAVSGSRLTGVTPPEAPRVSRRSLPLAPAALLLLAVAGGAFLAGLRAGSTGPPTFRRLTFRAGYVDSARFAPDGQSFVYAARWEGNPRQIFSARFDSVESRFLGLPDGDLAAISGSGELALILKLPQRSLKGTLARVPLAGGAPREVLEDVVAADWTADGQGLVVVRVSPQACILEYPIGTPIYRTASLLNNPRVSPDGERVAVNELAGENAALRVVERSGKSQIVSSDWEFNGGPAWSPKGDEIWFAGTRRNGPQMMALWAVDLSGRLRQVLRTPAALRLLDRHSDGRTLLAQITWRAALILESPEAPKGRNLSWLDWSLVRDISADGQTVVFDEQREGGEAKGAVYMRRADGSPAVRLGEGTALALSPDGKLALTLPRTTREQLVLLPTGVGMPKTLKFSGLELTSEPSFFPDGTRLLVGAAAPGRPGRLYEQPIAGGAPRPLSKEGFDPGPISPDGAFVAATGFGGLVVIVPVAGGEPRPVPGLKGVRCLRFTEDGRALFVHGPRGIPVRIERVDIATGAREPWKEIAPVEMAGVTAVSPVRITPDGRTVVYSVQRHLGDLFVVQGLR